MQHFTRFTIEPKKIIMKKTKRTQRPLLSIMILISGLFLVSCNIGGSHVIRGDGNVVSTVHPVDHFERIDITGVFDVILKSGDEPLVVLKTDENLQDIISVEVKNRALYVGPTEDAIYKHSKMELHITYPALEQIHVGGACKLRAENPVITEKLAFQISGAADIELELEVGELQTRVSGAGNLNFSGNAEKHSAMLSGASNLRAEDLKSKDTRISMSGAGSAHVYASDRLQASLSGVGTIRYSGNPKEIKVDKSGLGSIKAMD